MVLGTLIALLLTHAQHVVRVLLTAGLVLVWAMPAVVAVQVWLWMTNIENGLLNYILTQLHVGDYFQHDWYATTFSKLSMVTLLIVWGAIPFIAVTVYAGLAQVPRELVEAAEIDGAGAWRVFRDVTFPIIKPILLVLTSLSIIWDFGVFTQPFLLIDADAHRRVELPHGHLSLHRGLRQDRLRPRRRDLDPDAADRRGAQGRSTCGKMVRTRSRRDARPAAPAPRAAPRTVRRRAGTSSASRSSS